MDNYMDELSLNKDVGSIAENYFIILFSWIKISVDNLHKIYL